jgi:pimeloyl-ACP methyl ester carboxylesterase
MQINEMMRRRINRTRTSENREEMEWKMSSDNLQVTRGMPLGFFGPMLEYMTDAAQRSLLFWDVMRQRGNQYHEHLAETVPHVLDYKAELVMDGRTLRRPVNYLLARIVPPEGVEIDPTRRPFVVVDPRAGHGPGIGGFKADSEIGVAMKAGHPCYFVGFMPDPMPGQTIEDIARAEAQFLEKVISLHPQADGKPCVIGNCQAGWAVMILAAIRPELFGPLIVAGAPLSYWAGVRGQNPMRYSGGLLGGSWLTALTSDIGGGKFDGGWLVQNFENQNPANTLWTKQYNVYSKVDTEAPRYLEFERWWGGHVNLNAEEIQFIVDELFVGNNLAAGRIKTADGTVVDLRNIRSPIVVFCSKGDNITPPQQALDWILDLYDDVDEIRSFGQTIVYTVHETVGHLGIFVSGGVAKKEHNEFSSNIDLIDMLPPGLYEATFERKSGDTSNPDLVSGDWVMRCEARTLDDIRACRRSICRYTAPSCSRWSRPWSLRRWRTGSSAGTRSGCRMKLSPMPTRSCRDSHAPPKRLANSASRRERIIRLLWRRKKCPNRSSDRSMPGERPRKSSPNRCSLRFMDCRRCRLPSESTRRQAVHGDRGDHRCTPNWFRSASQS